VSTAATGITPGCPIIPWGQAYNTSNVDNTLALDRWYTTATQASTGVKTYTIPSGAFRYFTVGQPIIISGAGAASNKPLITTVVSVSGTILTVADANGTAITSLNVGNANPALAPQDGKINATPAAIAAWPFRPGSPYPTSLIALQDPTQGVSRGIRVVSNNVGDTGYNILATGYDIDGVAMSESINVTANGTGYGKKAWKYITNIALQKSGGGTLAGTVSVGTTDIFGFNLRTDLYEYTNMFWAGSFLTANTGYLAAVTTTASPTTGDVRGTIQVGPVGGGTQATASSADGTRRLALFLSLPQYNILNATNLASNGAVSLYGVTQA
jgi:hypothetical protein